MSLDFWRKLSYIAGVFAIGILFGLVIFSANVEIKDLDLWLHLKMGEFIMQHGYVPDVDVLSCTIAGKPWVNHEWLFQIIAYLAYSLGGPQGLISMQVFVVVITFIILLYLGYNRDKQFLTIFLLLMVMLVYRLRFTIRPDIFSLFFFISYIYILAIHIGKRWALYALFFIQVLWANFHGFFFFGPFIVLVSIVSEFIKRRVRLPWEWNEIGRLTNEEYSQLKKIFVAVILASLINPLTFEGAWYPVGILMRISGESRIFFSYIQELQRPILMNDVFSLNYIHYKLMIVLSFVAFVLNRRKIDIGDFFIWCVFLLISLVAVRNIVFFAFVAYLVCITNFGSLKLKDVVPIQISDKTFQYILAIVAKVWLITWMMNDGAALSKQGYFDYENFRMKSEIGGITQRSYPTGAVDFLVKNKVKGNFFNDFNSGAYLIGRCFPNIRVFIDGRTEVYGADFFKIYQKIWDPQSDTALFDEYVKRFNITGALLNSVTIELPLGFLKHLYESKDWALVYLDYDGAIFLRRVPANQALISKYRIDLSRWKTKKFDLMRLGSRGITPYRYVNKAYTLEALGFDNAALQESQEALKISPGYGEPYKIIGKIYGKKKEHQKAFENFRIAAMIMPQSINVRENLGLAYEKLKDFDGALRQYRRIIQQDPKNPKGYFLSARAYAQKKDHKKVIENIQKARSLDPKAVKDVLKIGDIFFEDKDYDVAREVYALVLGVNNKYLVNLYNKIGACYNALGLKDKAEEEFRKSRQALVQENMSMTNQEVSDKDVGSKAAPFSFWPWNRKHRSP